MQIGASCTAQASPFLTRLLLLHFHDSSGQCTVSGDGCRMLLLALLRSCDFQVDSVMRDRASAAF